MSEPYKMSITKTGDAIVCSIDMWRDVQEKIDRFFAERTEEEAVRQLREIGFERVVRCRDCERFIKGAICGNGFIDGNPDAFCSWGERRDA